MLYALIALLLLAPGCYDPDSLAGSSGDEPAFESPTCWTPETRHWYWTEAECFSPAFAPCYDHEEPVLFETWEDLGYPDGHPNPGVSLPDECGVCRCEAVR